MTKEDCLTQQTVQEQAGKKARCSKCWLCKPDDLNPDPQSPGKAGEVAR